MKNLIEKILTQSFNVEASTHRPCLEQVLERLSEPGYRIQRGDFDYCPFPPEIFNRLNEDTLKCLGEIDTLLLQHLDEYTHGKTPNSLDPQIIQNQGIFREQIDYRRRMLEQAMDYFRNHPKKGLQKLHKSVMRMVYTNELDRASINNRYKAAMQFMNDLKERSERDSGFYLDRECKAMISEIVQKLIELSEEQFKDRSRRLSDLQSSFGV